LLSTSRFTKILLRVHNKQRLMTKPRPIQWYCSQANLIWPDVYFTGRLGSRPDPKSLLQLANQSSRAGVTGSNKGLASQLRKWGSHKASLRSSLQYVVGTEHGYGLEKCHLSWRQASESASDVVRQEVFHVTKDIAHRCPQCRRPDSKGFPHNS
jgi:hypothetical protein